MTSEKNHRTFEPFARQRFCIRAKVMLTYDALLGSNFSKLAVFDAGYFWCLWFSALQSQGRLSLRPGKIKKFPNFHRIAERSADPTQVGWPRRDSCRVSLIAGGRAYLLDFAEPCEPCESWLGGV